jgi:hypothetical protein
VNLAGSGWLKSSRCVGEGLAASSCWIGQDRVVGDGGFTVWLAAEVSGDGLVAMPCQIHATFHDDDRATVICFYDDGRGPSGAVHVGYVGPPPATARST